MKVDSEPFGLVTVVTPHGPLTRDELADFVTATEDAVVAKDGRVVLDMHDVPYLDSGGIEALLTLCGAAGALVRPRLAQLEETCREALSLTAVLDKLDVFDTVESAVRSFKH